MIKGLWFVLLVAPFFAMADARFVEAPAECHIPYDNGNVDLEYKLQSCDGQLHTIGGGNTYDGVLFTEKSNLPGNAYVIDGQDVRDTDAYPSGVLAVTTSGAESGTDCNIVNAGGTTYTTRNWTATTRVYRTQNLYRVNVDYDLSCWGAVQAQ